jgi:hypothetical protein
MSKTDLPDLYTKKDVDRARTKGELVGLVKGVAVGVAGLFLLGIIGWIPTLAVIGVGGFVLYRLFSGPSKESE